jgi:glyoxylase-like metal-dependent hydrolase (beta-lactamase superfamily II)
MMNCLVEQVRTGGDRNFGYLAADRSGGTAALIDPSYGPEKLLGRAADLGLAVSYIFVTHGHADHTAGVERCEAATGLERLSWGDRDAVSGVKVAHGARFSLGELEIEILHTPGHTPDSICLLAGDALFTGDTLFVGKVGGTDLDREAEQQFESLRNVVLSLPDETRVFPGHDYGRAPRSTIGEERRTNPFLLRADLASFRDLKRNWAAYKKKHGIT